MLPQGSIEELAEALEVSPSGFHAWRHKPERPRRQQDQSLLPRIHQSFESSRRTYGCRRVQADLRQEGVRCGKDRVRRLMREAGLRPVQKRRFRPRTTDSRHPHPVAPNWLDKLPKPNGPGQLWQSDITYLPTGEGWLYLAFTLDGFSRRCVAHRCGEKINADLTVDTLQSAADRYRPSAGLVHHSDRGSQYAAHSFREHLARRGMAPSMSRSGNPYDNALAESFVATLKTECFGTTVPATRAIAQSMVFDYIECFYNSRRRHSALGYRSPDQFERQIYALAPEGCSGRGSQGGETCPQKQVGSSRLGCEQGRGKARELVQAAGNNPGTTSAISIQNY